MDIDSFFVYVKQMIFINTLLGMLKQGMLIQIEKTTVQKKEQKGYKLNEGRIR